MIKFEWDYAKADINRRKHGVTFEEKKQDRSFMMILLFSFFDDDHSEGEDRFILLGLSDQRRLLIVCHCERQHGEVIRIISARKATKSEAVFYSGI